MGRLGPKERGVFFGIKSNCYAGLGSAELLDYIGERLQQHLRADATCMVQLDPTTALPVYAVSRGWSQEDHIPLISHALLASPTADPGRLVELGLRTVVVDELVPSGHPFYSDPYFEYHLLPHGYRHELQTVCVAAKRGRVLLTVTRREESGSFEPRYVRLLDALAPHIGAGLYAASIRESLAAPAASGTGLIILNEAEEVELANPIGERWLNGPALPNHPGRLWALHVVVALLKKSLTVEGAAQVAKLEVADPSTKALYQLRAERTTDAEGRPRSLVLIEPVRGADRSETLLRLGLTPREAAVTLGILRGANPETLAQEAGVSPHTIRQHLRNVFNKLDVSSRRQLMVRLYAGF